MDKEFIIFSDESDKKGRFYSNFYGGLLVSSSNYMSITEALENRKLELGFFGEVKWKKVSERYLDKYIELIKFFFEFVQSGQAKIRIMFRQNAHQPQGLTPDDMEMEYFKLYYQFIKHGFGLIHRQPCDEPAKLRLYFDQFPDTREKADLFKGYLLRLNQNRDFVSAKLRIAKEDITEVSSHEHVLLQCLDVVLGSMTFRLNNKHEEKAPGANRRGNRTIAKEKLYKAILHEIRTIRPFFNIGISTGIDGDVANRWHSPYSHWCFKAHDSVYCSELTKGG